jgi:hypothetical protein
MSQHTGAQPSSLRVSKKLTLLVMKLIRTVTALVRKAPNLGETERSQLLDGLNRVAVILARSKVGSPKNRP